MQLLSEVIKPSDLSLCTRALQKNTTFTLRTQGEFTDSSKITCSLTGACSIIHVFFSTGIFIPYFIFTNGSKEPINFQTLTLLAFLGCTVIGEYQGDKRHVVTVQLLRTEKDMYKGVSGVKLFLLPNPSVYPPEALSMKRCN